MLLWLLILIVIAVLILLFVWVILWLFEQWEISRGKAFMILIGLALTLSKLLNG